MISYKDVPSYIQSFPKDIKLKLTEIRKAIKTAVPKSEESISYGMPGYKYLGKPLAYFAAFKNHIGFFPTPSAIKQFAKEIKKYKYSKGTVQFPLDAKVPTALIKKMVKFRMKQIAENAK